MFELHLIQLKYINSIGAYKTGLNAIKITLIVLSLISHLHHYVEGQLQRIWESSDL